MKIYLGKKNKSSQEPQNLPNYLNVQISDLPPLISRDNKPEQSKIQKRLFDIPLDNNFKLCNTIQEKTFNKNSVSNVLIIKSDPEATFTSKVF